jgi:MFS family permease
VYYLEGPVAIVFSAETLWSQSAAPHDTTDAETAGVAKGGDPLAVFRRAYVLVVLLGVLALGIPVAGVLIGRLPPGQRPLAWIGLLAVAIGFAWVALAWLRPNKPDE